LSGILITNRIQQDQTSCSSCSSSCCVVVVVVVVAGGVVVVLEVVVGFWLLANILTVQKRPSACHPTSFSEGRLTQQIG